MRAIPTGWTPGTIGSALKIRYGKANPPDKRRASGRYPVVGSAGTMARADVPLVEANSVVIGRKGNVGQVHLHLDGCWPTDTTYFAAIPHFLDPRFVAYQLQARELWRLDSSTATPSLRREDLEAQPFYYPSLREQRRIVDILEDHLSRLDAADELSKRANTRLTLSLEATIFRFLLGRDSHVLEASGDLRRAAIDRRPLPAGWAWSALGDVAEVVGGITKDSAKQSDPSFVEVPYLRVANVQRGRLDLSSVTTIRAPLAKVKQLELRQGDVLLNEGGDRDKLARGWVWEGQIKHCIHQNHVFRARVHPARMNPYFLSWMANTVGAAWAESHATQSVNLASISLRRIRTMPVPLPPLERQSQIHASINQAVADSTRLASALDIAVQRSAALRRSVLEAAFSGRLSNQSSGSHLVDGIATTTLGVDDSAAEAALRRAGGRSEPCVSARATTAGRYS